MTVGVIVAFVQYLARLYGPASALVGVQVQVVSAFAVFERIFDYLDMTPEAPQRRGCIALGDRARRRSQFEDVRFSYLPERVGAGRRQPSRASPGSSSRSSGPSGAGKTTIAQSRAALLRSARGPRARRRP